MKILLISDTHGQLKETLRILSNHQDADMVIHLGDIGFNLKYLKGCEIVRGNHDKNIQLPGRRKLRLEGRKALCLHGNIFDDETIEEVLRTHSIEEDDLMDVCMSTMYGKLAAYAKRRGCDTVFFGHTHHQCFETVDGVTLLNPGSVCFGTPQSGYAIAEISGQQITATFYAVDEE